MNTDKIQEAIESVVDDETNSIPPIPLNGIPSEEDSPEEKKPLISPLANASVGSWFFTFMCMNIPIIGWFYLFFLAFNKKKTDRRNFARAYLFYKLIFLLVAAVILGCVVYIGLGYLDMLLQYMEML